MSKTPSLLLLLYYPLFLLLIGVIASVDLSVNSELGQDVNMATQSDAPPNATDEKLRNPGAETVQPTNLDQQNAREESVKQSTTSAFVNSQPMREEQVQNAVKFLSHPKVKGSPVIYRRSFLEKKGLTKEEIDEAFQRVPDSPSVQTTGVNQDGKPKSSPNIQQQAQPQALQPGASASIGATTSGIVSHSRFHWSHALIAVGLLAASGAGTALLIKKSILPRLKSWIRNVVLEDEADQMKNTDSKPTLEEEAAQAAKAAAAAAAEMAKVSQELLTSKSEERRHFQEFVSHLDEQVQQMKLMTNAIKRLEASSGASLSEQEYQVTRANSEKIIVNGKGEYDMRSVRSSSPPASVEPATAPPPKSYMEIMAMVQRGEKPSNIRDINDSPPNPNQQPSDPRLTPKSKPWEVSQVQTTSNQVHISQANGRNPISKAQDTIQSNGDTPVPWWQRKNVRIREIDNEYEHNAEPYGAQSSQQPVRRSWVPPQPPPLAIPEAAEAIRRPKPAVPKEHAPDDQSSAHSSDLSNEPQRISLISDSEGAIESSSVNYGEIQEDEEAKYEEK